MIKNILTGLGLVFLLLSFSYGEDDHKNEKGHADHKGEKGHVDHADHKGEKGHDDHADHKSEKGHDDHGSGKSIGKGKAIEEVSEIKGFKLSKEAIKTLNLKLKNVEGATFKITKSTLVTSKNKKGVYRFRSGYFKFMPAKIIKNVKDEFLVEVIGVGFGDQIVTNGVGLLRVTDIYSTDKSAYGHAH